ncbi:CidA/LrgA family protein [Staphylococcus pragensis]|uniref:CidA/LrgA family protein n=1 Tax=Staphylococcus pragensis TaxID=1611836 RepID=A0A4Z1BXU7_9STAP|nr:MULTISPECIES: CidA/LrgA family protein [Staphylococcus]RTX89945.1 CidA/LrgA family protein [Staphylococcus carnosus]TGN27385.1 CidA/LrgA family protein [Staphylococcus pragensis]GGG93098.1 holin-like protein CidA [Staphylococcus pragensis]
MKKALIIAQIIVQVAIIIVISYIGSLLQDLLHIPLAGSIVGMILLYLLLEFKILRINWISEGAEFLLSTMVFFFIPSVVGIMDVFSNITKSYIIFFLLIIVGTSCVALVSGYIAEKMVKEPNTKKGNELR